MKILALDQSTTCTGYAIYEYKSKKLLTSGIIKLKEKDVYDRINIMTDRIKELIEQEEIIAVCYEKTGKIQGVLTAIKLGMLRGSILYMLNQKNILNAEININAHKSQFGIKSKKRDDQKAEAIQIVKMMHEKDVNDDEADAISIGFYFVNNVIIEGGVKNETCEST